MAANIRGLVLLQGRVVAVHEGGYSEQYVPFCGLAVIEQLAGVRTKVRDRACIQVAAGVRGLWFKHQE
jgi:acetoin utilization deacetylase AcuC-like enzyme